MGCGSTKLKTISNQIRPAAEQSKIHWKRGALIGKGAFGKVYECLNIETGEILATKYVKLSGDRSRIVSEIQNLKKEIILLKGLDHRNIVRYLYTEVSSDYSGVDILMEYVPGGSVRSLLNKFTKLEEITAQKYIKQLLEGLEYLHSKGIVHRDIKCANLLLSNDGTIKISDFGASSTEEICRSLKGSPYWIAPEVAKRKAHSYNADIWSVGCVLIEMITGSPPWVDVSRDPKTMLQFIANTQTPPPIPRKISRNCHDFIHACLKIDPSQRPAAQIMLQHRFVTDMIQRRDNDVSDIEYIDASQDVVYDLNDIPQTNVITTNQSLNKLNNKKPIKINRSADSSIAKNYAWQL